MIAALLLGLLLFGLGFLPLLGGPRYEAALLAGVLGPSFVGVASARQTLLRLSKMRADAHSDGVTRALPLLTVLRDASKKAVLGIFSVLFVALVHGLIGDFCEPEQGFSLLLLGPGVGMLLGAVMGALWALSVHALSSGRPPSARWAAAVPLFPLLSALIAVGRFYNTPTVYAYDQFAGYFAGPIYDAVVYDLMRLLSFRVGSGAWIASFFVLAAIFEVAALSSGRLGLRLRGGANATAARNTRLGLAALGFGFWGLGLAIYGHGTQLGHRATAASIQQSLGRKATKGPCDVHFGAGVSADAAMSVAFECVGHLKQHARYFAIPELAHVDVYLFSDVEEKRRYMGAARTNIAKPWRREVYITDEGFPHSILRHELAHVVTGEFGVGPLRVAGMLDGLVMDPGRVEGFAEAAALREESFGTLEEWAAAMKKVERLPGLRDVFQLGFWSTSASRSYTTAGAFVAFLRETYGPEVLRKWYGGEKLTVLTSESWDQLETAWHASLDAQPVSADVLAAAEPRFSRPGVFERRCPHAVDRKLGELAVACATQEARARRVVEEILDLDPSQVGLRLECPRCAAYAGKRERAIEETRKMLEQKGVYEPHEQRRAYEFLGDQLWELAEKPAAREAYQAAMKLNFDPAGARQLEVKLWALEQAQNVEIALRRLFLEQDLPGYTQQGAIFLWLEKGPEKDMARYLLARQAMAARRFDEARTHLAEMRLGGLPLESVKKEAAKMGVVLACQRARQDPKNAHIKEAFAVFEEQKPSAAELLHLGRLVERAELAQ